MSLSDVLFEAEAQVVYYLTNHYKEATETRARIERLLEEMDAIRHLPGFDTRPNRTAPERRNAEQIIATFTALEAEKNSTRLPSLDRVVGLGAEAFDPEVVANVQNIRAAEEAAETVSEAETKKEQPASCEGTAAANPIPNRPKSSHPYLRSLK